MDNETKLGALKALADPTRLHIVEFLASCCCAEAEVDQDGNVRSPTAGQICCHITGAGKITSTVSHHLHELEEAGIVSIERHGKTMVCALRQDRLSDLAGYLSQLADRRLKGFRCC